MPSRKRKSKSRKTCDKPKRTDSWLTIRRLLPPSNEIFHLADFVNRFAPSIKLDHNTATDAAYDAEDSHDKLHSLIISPLESIKPSLNLTKVDCRESVPSIIDDVVWLLVQRRERCKDRSHDTRNVLAQGFSCSPPDDFPFRHGPTNFPTIRPGLTQWQANDNVTFCKSSPLFHHLHRYVGDELFRMILLHTRLFVPLDSKDEGIMIRRNFCLVCGPPLTPGPLSELRHNDASLRSNREVDSKDQYRPRKKRRRCHPVMDPHLQANQSISRYNLFYSDSFTPRVGLHNQHPFHQIATTPVKLLALMTELNRKDGERRRKRWKRMRGFGLEICRKIIESGKKCDYHRLIDRYCPLPDLSRILKLQDKGAIESLVHCHCAPENVVSFVTKVLCKVFPHDFWGSQHNFNCVILTVGAFVSLRRSERLSNKRIVHGVRTTHMRWLQGNKHESSSLSRTDHESTCRLALRILRWLFRGFIIPLLRTNFYVTETEFSAKKVLYYRKPVWSAFRSLSMRKLLKAQFHELTRTDVLQYLSVCRMGFSRLRLVPKATGVRPIAHLSQAHHVNLKEFLRGAKLEQNLESALHPQIAMNVNRSSVPSTNSILANVFDVLTYESKRHNEPFGSGMSGMADFYPRYHHFITSLRHHVGRAQPLNLIFASVDIEKCYDNINQAYMYDVARRQFTNNDYMIQQYSLIYGDDVAERLKRTTTKIVGPPERCGLIHKDGQQLCRECNQAVLESRTCHLVQRRSLLNLLHEHLTSHLVMTTGRHEKRYLVQTSGISQGSILSMLLCNLYYGNAENLLLNNGNPQSPRLITEQTTADFLARQVDDFLFITTSKASVTSFVKQMWLGKPELGININQAKTLVSEEVVFDIEDENGSRRVIPPLANQTFRSSGDLFPWCGMLFDVRTGEVFVDYDRFQDGIAKNSLTVDSVGCEGRKLAARMISFTRPRCLPILFDSTINRENTIVTNFYQMMLFSAAKTTEYLRSSHVNPDVARNEDFLLRCINAVGQYAGRQIRSNLHRQCPNKRVLFLEEDLLMWLTWHAFFHVFSHLNDFSSLSRCIHSKLEAQRVPRSGLTKIVTRASLRFLLENIIKL